FSRNGFKVSFRGCMIQPWGRNGGSQMQVVADGNSNGGKEEAATFAQWLQRKLAHKGWNIAEFSRRTGIPEATASSWLRGQRVPGRKHIQTIAEAVGTTQERIWRVMGAGEDPSLRERIIQWIQTRPAEDELDQLPFTDLMLLLETTRLISSDVSDQLTRRAKR